MYTARITRNSPTAFVILIDQSGSMAEMTQFNNERMSKADAVALTVNMLISELLNRSRKGDAYGDYFHIAILGYHDEEVESLLPGGEDFLPISKLLGAERARVKIQKERTIPNGKNVVSVVEQKIWVEPQAVGKTPMHSALLKARELVRTWCRKCVVDCYPPTVINITDGEASDSDSNQLENMADGIKTERTNDGHALFMNIHIATDSEDMRVLFPASEWELPESRYAKMLFRMSSTLPPLYNDSVVSVRGSEGASFKGMSYNAAITDVIDMMNIGSVSMNML